MSLKIVPYGPSDSAKALAELLGAKRVKAESSTYVPRHFDHILNWGTSRVPNWMSRANARSVPMLNKPHNVNLAANKLSTFQRLSEAGVSIPEFTTSIGVAQSWLSSGATVVERHNLRGNSGDGIRIVNLDDPEMASNILSAPLYTKFINKSAEFRVHVFRGQVIDYIEKKKVSSDRRPANFNKYISSVNFGWVFTRTGIVRIPSVITQATRAVSALGLDFGAVDVVFNNGMAFVLEVNSSPGLKGTTLVAYGNAIRRFMGKQEFSPAEVAHLIDQTVTPTPAQPTVAAVPASVNLSNDRVTVTMSRSLARELKQLLAGI